MRTHGASATTNAPSSRARAAANATSGAARKNDVRRLDRDREARRDAGRRRVDEPSLVECTQDEHGGEQQREHAGEVRERGQPQAHRESLVEPVWPDEIVERGERPERPDQRRAVADEPAAAPRAEHVRAERAERQQEQHLDGRITWSAASEFGPVSHVTGARSNGSP